MRGFRNCALVVCLSLGAVSATLSACDKDKPGNTGSPADPKIKPSSAPSPSTTSSTLAGDPDPASSDGGATSDDDPNASVDAGPPKFPLALLPLGTFTIPVTAKVVAQPEIPKGFDPATSKPAPWVDKTEQTVTGDGKLGIWNFSLGQVWLLELTRDGKRVALWRDVTEHWVLDPAKEHLLFAHTIADDKGELYYQHVVVDLKTLTEHALPTTDCTHQMLFRGARLVGYGAQDTGSSGVIPTSICAFELDGTPVARMLGNLDWDHTRSAMLMSQMGFLPKDPDVFYATTEDTVGDAWVDRIYLLDVKNKKRVGAFELDNHSGEYKFDEFTVAHPVVQVKELSISQLHTVTAKPILAL